MRAGNLLPRFLLPPASVFAGGFPDDDGVVAATGLSREKWREVGRAFPVLREDPGRPAARAHRRLGFLVGRAVGSARHAPRWRGAPLPESPALFVTAHLGNLRGLRYLLRQRIPAANVITDERRRDPWVHLGDLEFDRRFPREFPHVLPAASPHHLRSALKRGSLIVAADVPVEDTAPDAALLGGRFRIDVRPFRLARLAGVRCLPIFLTSPRGRLTLTIGPDLPAAESEAALAFALAFASVAAESPFELDGPTRWGQLH